MQELVAHKTGLRFGRPTRFVGTVLTECKKICQHSGLWSRAFSFAGSRVARVFLVKQTKTGKNIPGDLRIYQTAIIVYQITVKYSKWQ
jgi:hypothetical protein